MKTQEDTLNVQGTTTGRISSKRVSSSNAPKADDELGDDEKREVAEVLAPFLWGMHLGPKTRETHPYSFDPLLVFDNGKGHTGSVYSDHFSRWYGKVLDEKLKAHFGNESDSFNFRSAPKIQVFLRDLLGQPELELTRIEEHCNASSGFSTWRFFFRGETSKLAN